MAYEKYVSEFTDNQGQVYGVMDAEGREGVDLIKSAISDTNSILFKSEYTADFTLSSGGISSSTGGNTSNSARARTDFIGVKPGVSYLFDLSNTDYVVAVVFLYNSASVDATSKLRVPASGNKFIVNVNAPYSYIRISFMNALDITQTISSENRIAIENASKLYTNTDESLTINGVAADAKATGDAVGELKSALVNSTGASTGNNSVVFNSGFYYPTNSAGSSATAPIASANWQYAKLPCVKGDIFTVYLYGQSGDKRAFAILDANNIVLYRTTRISNFTTGQVTVDYDDAAYIVFNNRIVDNANPYAIKGIPLVDRVTATETAIAGISAIEELIEELEDETERLENRKANKDGYYSDLTAGNAEQLISTKTVEDDAPYKFRAAGGTADVGNREYLEKIIGGTVAWNQLTPDTEAENTVSGDIATVTDAKAATAKVKVQIEPVQDLHGYDNPWPAGGGKNLLDESSVVMSGQNIYGSDGAEVTGTRSGFQMHLPAGTYTIHLEKLVQNYTRGNVVDSNGGFVSYFWLTTSTDIHSPVTITLNEGEYIIIFCGAVNATLDITNAKLQIEAGSTGTDYAPYANICPITGWTGANVTRAGKNLFDPNVQMVSDPDGGTNRGYPLHIPAGTYTAVPTIKGEDELTYSYLRGRVIHADGTYEDYKYFSAAPASAYVPRTFTLREGDWLFFYRAAVGHEDFVVLSGLQVELGDETTAYETYSGTTYPISWQTEAGTVYGGELTINDDGTATLVVDTACSDFGDLTWSKTTTSGNFTVFYVDLPGKVTGKKGKIYKCTDYKCVNVARTSLKNRELGFYNLTGYTAACLRDDSYSSYTTTEFKTAMTGVKVVYELNNYILYTLTPIQVSTLLGLNNVWADTGDIELTYKSPNKHHTLLTGHKYLTRISGTDAVVEGSGQEVIAACGTDNIHDLTLMLGSTIADYIYSTGGASWFRNLFPAYPYAYNAGELISVSGLQSHKTVGFNQWDEEWELGNISPSTGQNTNATDKIRSKNYIHVLPNTTYYFKGSHTYGLRYYDANKKYISSDVANYQTRTTPNNCHYMRFIIVDATTYNNNLCVNISHSGIRNGEYEPYVEHIYPFDSTLTLRGIPKLDAGSNLYYDGDEYAPDGKVTRKYDVVNLGDLTWVKSSTIENGFVATGGMPENFPTALTANSMPKWLSADYKIYSNNGIGAEGVDKAIAWRFVVSNLQGVVVRDNAYANLYQSNDMAGFKTAMTGKMLLYEVVEPTTEEAAPYQEIQQIDDWGTEEFVSGTIVPVGQNSKFPANLRDKLQHLPSLAESDGLYLVRQIGNECEYEAYVEPDIATVSEVRSYLDI